MANTDALNKAIGQKLTSFDVSDDGTCIVLFFEDVSPEPVIINLFSSKEIAVE